MVLADDHAVVRSGLRRLLEDAAIEVVAETGDAAGAVRSVRGHKPDVVLLDLNMPGEPAIAAIPAMLDAAPETRVVVLTMHQETALAREALRAGASGYLLKEAAEADLIAAIDAVRRGGTYLHPALGARMATEPGAQASWPDGMTGREIEVLRLLALGHTNAEIGAQLYLSTRTVESHRAHIHAKAGLHSRAELVRYAIDHGVFGQPAVSHGARPGVTDLQDAAARSADGRGTARQRPTR